MSSVDDRIVNMQFNNSQFIAGASDSAKALTTLEETIAKTGSGAGMTSLGASVDGVSAKFSALQVAGVTALATIVNKAVTAGLDLLKNLTVGPLLDGFHEYETNLNSIQTIMANTGKDVQTVNKYLQQLNHYSDLTIYSFTQMAESIGKFTAAGVNLPQATLAIKGLANTAALSGSNVQQLNTAMYQMSQALSTGTIRLMDWNSLANAGMGGENIREALMATNRTLGDNGAAMDAAIKSAGDFRNSLAAGWLTAETFTKTMKVMAGTTTKGGKTIAYTVEQLKKMGFAEDAAKKLNVLSQAAIESATKVKTFSQLIDVVKESIGSGWAKVFQDLFGNFTQATKLWTGVSESITGVVSDIFGNVDRMLIGWRQLGGYQDLWTGFANIFKTIGNLLHPFVAAFQAILPATGQAGAGLAKLTKGFADVTGFVEKLSRGANVLTPVLIAVFSVFGDIAHVIGSVIQGLAPLINLIGNLASELGGLVQQGAEIGSSIIEGMLQGLDASAIQAAVENFATSIVDWIKGALGINSPAAELIPVGIAIVQGIAEGIFNAMSFIGNAMGQLLGALMDGFQQLFGGMDALDWTAFFNAILTGGLLLSMRSLTKTLDGFVGSLTSSLNAVTSPFKQMTSTLKTMQNELRAKILLDIAIAVGILAASLIALSLVKPQKLALGLGAISAIMGLLVSSLWLLATKIDPKGLFAMAASILLISTSMAILSGAIAVLGNLGLDTLAKGLGAMAIALGIMVVALKGMAGLGVGLPAAATAIFIMAAAMTVMSAAVLAMGKMDLGTLAKGLGAIAIGLALFTTALVVLTAAGPGVAAAGAGIFIVASAMVVMAAAIGALGNMDIGTLAKGLGTMAVGLVLFVAALVILTAMGPGVAAAAGAIVLMSTAMLIMATAIGVLGSQGLDTIAKGLTALALGFAILLVAAAAAIPLAPGLIALGVSVALLGAGIALLGVGLLAAATAFTMFAVVGTAGIAVVMAGFSAFMALLPQFAMQLATAFVVFIQAIAAAAPKLRDAFGKILKAILGTIKDAIPEIKSLAIAIIDALLQIITNAIPKLGKLFKVLIRTVLDILRVAIPDFVDAGLDIILAILRGIADHVDKIVTAATNIAVKFISSLSKGLVKIVDAAGKALVEFLNGLADAIETYSPQIRDAGVRIAVAIINGLTGGLIDHISDVVDAAGSVVGNVVDAFKSGFGIFSPSSVAHHWGEMIVDGLVNGITANIVKAVGAVIALTNAAIAAGNKAVKKAQTEAEKKQIASERAAAKARVSAQLASAAEREAKQNPKNKALEKAAKAARKLADRQAKAADAAQKRADAAAQRVANVQQFQEADAQGKGDILTAQAKALSDRAVKMLAQANAEAQAAKKLQGKQRKDMIEAARKDAKAAKDLADKSRAARNRADDFYAQSVQDRIKAIVEARKADEKAQRDQAELDNATDTEKADILRKRAEAAQARADKAQKKSDDLIKTAKKLAKTDAARAQRLLDRAEVLAQEAKDAAAEAQQDQQQAQQYADQAKNPGSGTGSDGFTLSQSAMEDAAAAIDRYTKSLQQAEEAAMAATPVYQFVQNNNSPDSLSDTEIYRQTRNLLSAAEIKMGAPT